MTSVPELCNNCEKTSTYTSLMENGILSAENRKDSNEQREAIQEIFGNLQEPTNKAIYR